MLQSKGGKKGASSSKNASDLPSADGMDVNVLMQELQVSLLSFQNYCFTVELEL